MDGFKAWIGESRGSCCFHLTLARPEAEAWIKTMLEDVYAEFPEETRQHGVEELKVEYCAKCHRELVEEGERICMKCEDMWAEALEVGRESRRAVDPDEPEFEEEPWENDEETE
jgi:hypothetical protein